MSLLIISSACVQCGRLQPKPVANVLCRSTWLLASSTIPMETQACDRHRNWETENRASNGSPSGNRVRIAGFAIRKLASSGFQKRNPFVTYGDSER